MVTWQKLVELAFDEVERKGATFEGIDEGGDFLTDLSVLWDGNKHRLKQMTEQQARNYLRDRVEP